MAKTKFEKLIEHILNDDNDAARELFHDIVVEKSREIYTDIVAEDEENNDFDSLGEYGIEDQTDDMSDDIEADQDGMGMDSDMEDNMEDEMEDDEGMEDRVEDLESALDELKAEFDRLMADEGNEEEHADLGTQDFGMDDDMEDDMESMGDDMEDMDDDEEDDMPKEDMVREYVEKVPAPSKTESGAYTRSPVANKNDMGGTAANIAKGGANGNPTSPAKPNNAYTKGQGDLGAVDTREAGKKAFTGKAPAAAKGENGVNARSPMAK